MNMKHCLLCLLCSDRRGRELLHRAKIRPQPESRLNGDPPLREQPGGEDGGDVLRKSQLLMIMLAKTILTASWKGVLVCVPGVFFFALH